MALSKLPYRGTRDFFPAQMRLRNYIFSKMAEISEQFAYEPYDGPILEEVDLYLAKSGEELINEQIYSFTDRGDRKVAIRPEMTPTVARMAAQVHREIAKPIRWYSIPNLMRYEKMQRGRLREFWQYNADIFGAGQHGELEIIQLAVALMKSFGATSEHFEVLINDRRFVEQIFTQILGCSEEQKKALYKLTDRSQKIKTEDLHKDAQIILGDSQKVQTYQSYLKASGLDELKKLATQAKLESTDLISLLEKIQHLGLSEYVRFDSTIVRGLDYYTGIVFEIFDKNPENRRAVAGGGAYANLLQIFNEPALEGVGIGLGEVPLTLFLETHKLVDLNSFAKPEVDFLVAYLTIEAEEVAMKLAQTLRNKNQKVELFFGEAKPKKIFSYSDKKQFKYICFIGEEEFKNSEIKIKNLAERTEHTYKLNETLHKLGLE